MKKSELSKEIINKVIYNYTVLRQGQKTAGKEFGFSDKKVKKILQDNNIHIRTLREANQSYYKIDTQFFFKESENLAYLLGLIASDGNVHSTENRIEIELQNSDGELLEKIRKIIKLERPIKYYECNNGYKKSKLYFYSKEIKDKLATYNIIPQKTYSEKFDFPFVLNKKYWIDYIRGLFDGDGSIKNNGSITFQIDCTKLNILKTIQNFLLTEYDIETSIASEKKVNTILYRLYCHGKEKNKKIYNILYFNKELYLKRKKEKFEELLDE